MRLTLDRENNVGYLYLTEIDKGGVAHTVTVNHHGSIEGINLDYDADGALLGIEFLNAEVQLRAMREGEKP